MIARAEQVIAMTPAAEHRGEEGKFVVLDSGAAKVTTSATAKPLGVILEGAAVSGKSSIGLPGFSGTVKVKVTGASPGTIALGTYLTVKSDGTIQDLRSVRRMKVALETNVRMAQGKARWERFSGNEQFPAMELVRIEARRVPREWAMIWAEEAAGYPRTEVCVEPPMALHGSGIWLDISRFGVPWPPYNFGSGMGQKPVARDRAMEVGLDPDGATTAAEDLSLNHALEVTPQVSDGRLREALSEGMQGYAEWEGDRLVFTDPNGTRPTTAEALAEVWDQGLPEGFALHQRDALVDWVRDSRVFYDRRTEDDAALRYGRAEYQPGTNVWRDLQRLIARLVNGDGEVVIYRGLTVPDADLKGLLKGWRAEGYSPHRRNAADSWTNNRRSALNYAGTGGDGGRWAVVLEWANPRQAKDVTALVRSLTERIGKLKSPTVAQDAEWLLPRGARVRVVSVRRDAGKRTYFLKLSDE